MLLGVRPLHENKHINLYVNKVGLWLASNSSRPELPWQFGVIDSESINAFAAPGGYVFITSSMLLQLNNEAELAATLAHKISHITLFHHIEELKKNALLNAASETFFVTAEAYQDNTDDKKQTKEYTGLAKTVTSAAQELYTKGLDRDDELHADERAIRLLAKSGYDPLAYFTSLQIIEAISPDDTSLALLYKAHPTPTERIQNLQSSFTALEHINGHTLEERFKSNIFAE